VPWDTEKTKTLLLEAAVEEFGEHGFAGSRIERIGARAGVSNERIYRYFGNKVGLFEEALTGQLVSGLDDVRIVGSGADAVAAFAADYFDASVRNPGLARLTAWEALERITPVGLDRRRVRSSNKVAEITSALPDLDRRDAEDLLLTIVVLVHSWTAGRNLGQIVTGDPDDNARRRNHIVATVRAIVAIELAASHPQTDRI
jgi:AcrR family transcriptional regulator